MNEDTPVFLVEVFDCAGIGVDFDSAGDGAGEFLVREGNPRNLGLEGACDEGAEEVAVRAIAVPGVWAVAVVYWEDTGVFEGGDELGAVG